MKPVILDSSPEAASPVTLTGWLSCNGHFYTDERMARWDGCTHQPCEGCGKPTSKHYLRCDACREVRNAAAFAAMEKRPWDGKQMLYCETRDKYFSDPDEAVDDWFAEVREGEPRVVLCEPVFASALDVEHWSDDFPGEEHEVPDVLQALVDEFNEKLAKLPELSWTPGKYALL